MQHTAVLLGNSSTLNKRGENPPRCNRTTPADFSLANPAVNAQTIFSFSVVMAFHEALKIADELAASSVVRGIESPYKKEGYYLNKMAVSDGVMIALFISTAAMCILV